MSITNRLYKIIKNLIPLPIKIFLRQLINSHVHKAFSLEYSDNKISIEEKLQSIFGEFDKPNFEKVKVLTPKHTLKYASDIVFELQKFGINASLETGFTHEENNGDLWFVLCPQIFEELPSADKRIVFQMEQLHNERWVTEKYKLILKESIAIVDYAIENIEIMQSWGFSYKQMFLLPVTARPIVSSNSISQSKTKVVFYGDTSSDRRKEQIEKAKSLFNLQVYEDVFEEQINNVLSNARVVLNLHYYSDAILETVRINECLSNGVLVISEITRDAHLYPEYKKVVWYFEPGDLQQANKNIKEIMELSEEEISSRINESLEEIQKRFRFMFGRLLVGLDLVNFEALNPDELLIDFKSDICLSLPETIERRKHPISQGNFSYFDGIRHPLGWIGCGMSYKFLAKKAKTQYADRILIVEDDIVLPTDYEGLRDTIMRFLEETTVNWDVFSGMISNIREDAQILDVIQFDGMQFVILNDTTSTVFNVFSSEGIDKLINWNHDYFDLKLNTIDRYLSSRESLIAITIFPFQFGHDSNKDSSLWNFNNREYESTIIQSEMLLHNKILEFQNRKSTNSE